MTPITVLIRNRRSGEVTGRIRDEPVKLRVCRGCGRAHPEACPAAAQAA